MAARLLEGKVALVINALFTIDYIRLLALMVLLPTYLALRKHPGDKLEVNLGLAAAGYA